MKAKERRQRAYSRKKERKKGKECGVVNRLIIMSRMRSPYPRGSHAWTPGKASRTTLKALVRLFEQVRSSQFEDGCVVDFRPRLQPGEHVSALALEGFSQRRLRSLLWKPLIQEVAGDSRETLNLLEVSYNIWLILTKTCFFEISSHLEHCALCPSHLAKLNSSLLPIETRLPHVAHTALFTL